MSPSGAEVLRGIKSRIDEVDPGVVREQITNGAVLVDVREVEEYGAGHIPGAKHVPKSYIESRIEGAAPDRSQHVILYCQSGNRSAWAAYLKFMLICCRRATEHGGQRKGTLLSASDCRRLAGRRANIS